MPKIKRNVSDAPDRTGFESYDGPEPRAGVYRGKIKMCRIRKASTGTMGINVLVEFEARKGSDSVQYDGYPAWVNLWLTDKEGNMAREKQFYRALGIKSDEPDIIHDELDDKSFADIKKIGGKNPVGSVVKVDMKSDLYEGVSRLQGDAVYPVDPSKETNVSKAAQDKDVEDDEDDDLLEDDEDEERPDYESMPLPKLRREAKEAGIDTKGKSKSDLVDELVDWWGDSGAEEDEDEDEDEDEPSEAGTTLAEAKAMSLPDLRKFAATEEGGGYDKEDLKGVSKSDILELMKEDGVFEPPF